MEYRRLGRTGLKVSRIALGTMSFGRWIDEASSAQILDAALDAGINFIDTADFYGRGQDSGNYAELGEAEAILGRLLRHRRHDIVLATKVYNAMGPGPNDRGLSRKHIMAAVEASLRRLQTDYIDLYQCHFFDPETPLEETMEALNDLVRQGKVRYIGCSNFAAWQIAKANGISAVRGWASFVSVQPQYSLLVRDVERELVPFCLSEGVGMIPYSPMGRGILTGKYRKGQEPPAGSRLAAGEARLKALITEQNLDRAERFREVCAEWGLPMAQVAVAWVLGNEAVTAAIVGASRVDHLNAAIAAEGLNLTAEQRTLLDEIFPL